MISSYLKIITQINEFEQIKHGETQRRDRKCEALQVARRVLRADIRSGVRAERARGKGGNDGREGYKRRAKDKGLNKRHHTCHFSPPSPLRYNCNYSFLLFICVALALFASMYSCSVMVDLALLQIPWRSPKVRARRPCAIIYILQK